MGKVERGKKKIFFFLPYYHTGGAEKVHLEIVKCFRQEKCVIFFTDRSRDNKNKKEFRKNAICFNLFGVTNKIKIIEKIFVFLLSYLINWSNNTVVFGSNSRFFYSLTEKLGDNIKKIDLVHWLDGEIGQIIIKNTEKVDERVVVTEAIIPVLSEEYRKNNISNIQIKKIKIIENRVSKNDHIDKDYGQKITILYIGRNTYEKRPELAFAVHERLRINENIEFIFLGRGLLELARKVKSEAKVIERIDREKEMNEIYKQAHVIILTSIFEGFPCVFMEAMSFGVVPISTAVGGIPVHLKHGENALLVYSNSEKKIIEDISMNVLILEKDRKFLQQLSQNAYQYSLNKFSNGKFCDEYKKIFYG